jgi:hypothetical protein
MGWWGQAYRGARLVLDLSAELAGIHQTLASLRGEVSALRTDLEDLKRTRGLAPRDLELRNGIPWGLVGTASNPEPFCPGCAGKLTWTPLTKSKVYPGRSRRPSGAPC